MSPYWSLHKFPFCLLLYFKVSLQFLLLCSWTWAQDQNSDAVYYGTVKMRNLVIIFSRQKTQEVQLKHEETSQELKHKEISLKLDFFIANHTILAFKLKKLPASLHSASCHIFIINLFSIHYFSAVTTGLRMYVWLAIEMHFIM